MSIFFSCLLGLNPRHMEVLRSGVKSELPLLAYPTATATQDLIWACNIHHSSLQCQIADPLNQDRDWTHILMDTIRICFHCTTMGTPLLVLSCFRVLPRVSPAALSPSVLCAAWAASSTLPAWLSYCRRGPFLFITKLLCRYIFTYGRARPTRLTPPRYNI